MKELIASIANHSGLLDVYSFLRRKHTKSQVAILMYHRVCPKRNDWELGQLSPQDFGSKIQYFCRNYEILSLDKLVQCLQQGKPLPEKAIVITLDDGYKNNYVYAYPILKKYNVPATIFLTTGLIGNDRLFWPDKVMYIINYTTVEQLNLDECGNYSLHPKSDKRHIGITVSEKLKRLPDERKNVLIEKLADICQVSIPPHLGEELILSWDEVKEMSNDGITFGTHTVNHPILTNLPLERAKWEITQSKKDIEEKLGKEVTAFSYPNGDFNAEVAELVRKSGFTYAVSVSPCKLISPKDNLYALSRIGVGADFNKFKVMFSGLWGDLQGILRQGRG